jgi:uncharacterized membrane protein
MNEYVKILVIAIGLAVLDLPWLWINSKRVADFVNDIQGGRSMNLRLWAGIPVYIALGYMVTQQTSAPRAFLIGLCTYAVYDFTQVFVLDRYPIEFAFADTLWGGLLMALAWWIAHRVGLVASDK